MNIAVSPQTIPIAWQDYLARNYDRTLIPWPRYRYSGTGVVEVPTEAAINNEIALNVRDIIIGEVKQAKGKVYINGIGVEVTRSEKEERIPDIVVVSKEGVELIDRETHVITLDMPAPILVVEVVSPSSVKGRLGRKAV